MTQNTIKRLIRKIRRRKYPVRKVVLSKKAQTIVDMEHLEKLAALSRLQ